MKGKVSIKDIARITDVSPSTVSRVLSGHPRASEISLETRNRIWKAAGELGYVPNMIGRYLRLGLKFPCVGIEFSRGVGTLVEEPFFWIIANEVSALMSKAGFQTIYLDAKDVELFCPEAQGVLRHLLRIIITLGRLGEELSILRDLGIPLICIFPSCEIPEALALIDTYDENGIYEGLKYLERLGHKNVLFVSGKTKGLEHPAFKRRREVFIEKAKGIGSFLAWKEIFVEEWHEVVRDNKFQQYGEIVKCIKEFTAIFAANDYIAYWLVRLLNAYGIRIPQEKSIIGFDDLYFSQLFNPPLTTVTVPVQKIAKSVSELCLRMLENDYRNESNHRLVFDVELTERGSCAPPLVFRSTTTDPSFLKK